MGILTAVKDWWKWIYQHKVTAAVIHSSYKVGASLAAQVPASAHAALSIVTHPPTRRIAKHLVRVAVVDLGGLILLTYVNEQIQKAGRDYLGDDLDNTWFSTTTALNAGLTTIEIAAQLLYIRNRLRLQVHTVLINLDSPVLSQTDTSPIICKIEQCATMDYLKGSMRDFSSYWATEVALLMAERLPIPGAPLVAFIARIHHNGRFIVTVAKSARCYDHQLIYLKEAPETAFALGLGHASSTFLINAVLERMTGLSAIFYYPIMQLMLIPQISVASHMKLTDLAKASKDTTWDPVAIYQEKIDFLIETLALGTEQQIIRRIRAKKLAPGSLGQFLQTLPSSKLTILIAWAWHHPLSHIILPSLLQNADNFIQDPLVRDNWPTFQANFVSFLKTIETGKKGRAAQVVNALPGTSMLIHLYFGIPEAIIKLLLTLINDQAFMEIISNMRYQLETLQLEKSTSVKINYESLMLNGYVVESPISCPETLPDNIHPSNVNDVIRRAPRRAPTTEPDTVIRRAVVKDSGSRDRFFQNPTGTDNGQDDMEDGFVYATYNGNSN